MVMVMVVVMVMGTNQSVGLLGKILFYLFIHSLLTHYSLTTHKFIQKNIFCSKIVVSKKGLGWNHWYEVMVTKSDEKWWLILCFILVHHVKEMIFGYEIRGVTMLEHVHSSRKAVTVLPCPALSCLVLPCPVLFNPFMSHLCSNSKNTFIYLVLHLFIYLFIYS